VVTEHATNNVDVFQVQTDGTLGPILGNSDLEFARNGALLISEADRAGGSDAYTISFYSILANETFPRSGRDSTLGNATCWNPTMSGRWVYVSEHSFFDDLRISHRE
jgi:6-phosphogluconolactonase